MISRIQWQSPGLFWLSMLAMAAVMTAALVFYWPQVRPLARRAAWAWILPWVRTLALGVLAIALLRPAILTPLQNDNQGIVAVLIDRSRSMNAVDTARQPEQLVRIAAGLGKLSVSTRPGELSRLRERVAGLARLAEDLDRAATEQKYARLAGRGMEAADAHFRVARNSLADAVKAVAASTSLPLGESIASIGGDNASKQIVNILDQIDAQQVLADVELYKTNASVAAICDNQGARSRIELVSDSLASETFEKLEKERPVRIYPDASSVFLPGQFDPAILLADEVHTDLVGQLRELHRRLTGQHIAAVVLFSDGRENNLATPVDALVDWPEVPILAVDVGSPRPRDLSIEKVSAPTSVAVGEMVRVRAGVHRQGFDAGEIEVIFTAQGQRQTKRVSLVAESASVEFTFAAEHAGPCRVTLAIAPENGEASVANNQISRTIKVTSDRSAVVIIAGSATPDIQQLGNLLKNAPGVSLVDGSLESGKCPLTPADLRQSDVVVLSDVPLGALDAQQWDAINSVATQRGGSVIICAGEPSILASYSRQPLIASMLPWRGDAQPAWRTSPGDAPAFRVAPSDAQAFEAIRLSSDADVNRLRWNLRPPVSRIMSLPALRPNIRTILADRDSASPVLTQVKSGAGRSFFIATDELSRWYTAGGDGPQEQGRFWIEFIRMAGRQPYAISAGELSLDADRLSLEPGEPLKVRARLPAAEAKLRIERDGSSLQEKLINPNDAPGGRYEAVFNDLDTGNYTLRLVAGDREISLPITVVVGDEEEMRDISGNPAELARIAGSRGDVLTLAELPSLPQRLTQLQITETRFNETRLWDSPYLFMFVVACFGVEWAVRKHVGLT